MFSVGIGGPCLMEPGEGETRGCLALRPQRDIDLGPEPYILTVKIMRLNSIGLKATAEYTNIFFHHHHLKF